MAVPAATNAVLPLRATTVAMKTLAATAMAGAQTINNQLKAALVMAMETAKMAATTMMMETKGKMAAAARRWWRRPAWQWRRQLGKSAALVAAASFAVEAAAW